MNAGGIWDLVGVNDRFLEVVAASALIAHIALICLAVGTILFAIYTRCRFSSLGDRPGGYLIIGIAIAYLVMALFLL